MLGDDPVVERAPIVDLWVKAARRAGAEVIENEIGAADEGVARVRQELGDRIRSTERTILIWSGPKGNGGARVAALAAELGLAEKPGSAAFHLPETANGRGVADGWAAAADGDEADPEPIELLIVSGDEAAANPDVRALADRAERVLAISMFRSPVRGWADLVLPGTSYLERDGTYVNLEGRLQRLRRAVIPPCPDELAWIAKLAQRFDVEVSPYPPQVFAELSERCFGGVDYPRSGTAPPCRRAPRRSRRRKRRPAETNGDGKGLRLVTLPPALRGAGHRAHPGAPVPAPRARDRARTRRRDPPRRRARLHGSRPLERHLGRPSRAREQKARRRSGPRRIRARPRPRNPRRGQRHERALVDRPDQSGRDHQPAARHVRVHDVGRAQGPRAHAAPLRPEPRGALRPPAADRRPREADPQGELLPGDRGRLPVHHGADHVRLHRARRLRGHPLGRGLARSPATTSPVRSPTSRSR